MAISGPGTEGAAPASSGCRGKMGRRLFALSGFGFGLECGFGRRGRSARALAADASLVDRTIRRASDFSLRLWIMGSVVRVNGGGRVGDAI
ncbi:hypothetical protein BD310DRAFT_952100 [Dichomitus squalens]|uniref:Uncharacterized protein n=1 Tax=Dichomitus squalens TaxID=114155 RepID=A0A4Q9PIG8_9APHY|nr:hypothetical protein BD310DRAFT_952100 [Dichomitus squalens]